MAVPVFMVLSGYTWSLSYERNGDSISEVYALRNIIKKILRFTIPYIPVIAAEGYIQMKSGAGGGIAEMIEGFMTGGYGPGGYYYPVMIQLVFIFPAIYYLIKSWNAYGFLLCIFTNAAYDFLRIIYHIRGDSYRILVFRFIMVIAFGCLLSLNQDKKIKKRVFILLESIGIFFIVLIQYMGFLSVEYLVSFVCAFFVLPWVYILLRKELKSKLLMLIGRASYNIYLLQMLYYWKVNAYVGKYIQNMWLWFFSGVVICCVSGILYWMADKRVTPRIIMTVDRLLLHYDSKRVKKKFNMAFFK